MDALEYFAWCDDAIDEKVDGIDSSGVCEHLARQNARSGINRRHQFATEVAMIHLIGELARDAIFIDAGHKVEWIGWIGFAQVG